jgi:VWFA-related protein
MKAIALSLVACGLSAGVGGHQAPQAQTPPVFRARASSVVIDVAVRDGRRSVSALTQDDFLVTDNGIVQRVDVFDRRSVPLDVVLLIDSSTSTVVRPNGSRYNFRRTAIAEWMAQAHLSIRQSLRPDDALTRYGFASGLRQLGGLEEIPRSLPEDAYLRRGRTALFDAIAMTLMRPPASGRRRAIVVLSDGHDTASVMGEDLQRAVADRSDGTVYLVALGGRVPWTSVPASVWNDGYEELIHDITERTGGRVLSIAPGDDFSDRLEELLEELRSRYTLAFTPEGVSATGWHRLEVGVKGRKYDVSARRGYWADNR